MHLGPPISIERLKIFEKFHAEISKIFEKFQNFILQISRKFQCSWVKWFSNEIFTEISNFQMKSRKISIENLNFYEILHAVVLLLCDFCDFSWIFEISKFHEISKNFREIEISFKILGISRNAQCYLRCGRIFPPPPSPFGPQPWGGGGGEGHLRAPTHS